MSKKFNKRVVNTLKYVYKVGLLKSIFISMTMLVSGAEYEIKWRHRPVHLRKKTTDLFVFKQIFAYDQYGGKRLKELDNVKTIIDLGANIGLSPLYFKMQYPNARIIALEPEKKNYDLLVKNVSGLTDVHCLNNAIWNVNTNLGIYNIGLGEYGFVVNEQNESKVGNVRAVTMDEIIERFQIKTIDVLKIDIEGSEKELFSGNCESWLPKVRSIVIELHDWFRPGCAASFFRAISMYDYTMNFKGENISIIFKHEQTPVMA